MKIQSAESIVQSIYGGSSHVELNFNPVIEIRALELVQKFKEAQADTLRFTANYVLSSPDDCCGTSDALHKLANQLHPLREGKEPIV